MLSIQDLIKQRLDSFNQNPEQTLKEISKPITRKEAIKQIYELYSSPTQKNFRKRENWKRYISYLKANRLDENKLGRTETIKLWKKKGKNELKYLKEMTAKELAIYLAPFSAKNNNIDALHYLISLGKDMNNRKENFSSFFMWSTNYKNLIK